MSIMDVVAGAYLQQTIEGLDGHWISPVFASRGLCRVRLHSLEFDDLPRNQTIYYTIWTRDAGGGWLTAPMIIQNNAPNYRVQAFGPTGDNDNDMVENFPECYVPLRAESLVVVQLVNSDLHTFDGAYATLDLNDGGAVSTFGGTLGAGSFGNLCSLAAVDPGEPNHFLSFVASGEDATSGFVLTAHLGTDTDGNIVSTLADISAPISLGNQPPVIIQGASSGPVQSPLAPFAATPLTGGLTGTVTPVDLTVTVEAV